jgi:hypothetical protein
MPQCVIIVKDAAVLAILLPARRVLRKRLHICNAVALNSRHAEFRNVRGDFASAIVEEPLVASCRNVEITETSVLIRQVRQGAQKARREPNAGRLPPFLYKRDTEAERGESSARS